MASPNRVKLPIYAGDTFGHYLRFTEDGGRVVYDGVTSSGLGTISSAKAHFTAGDIGTAVFSPTYVDAGTLIESVSADGLTANLSGSAGATATGGATFVIRSVDVSSYEFAAQMRANPRSNTILATFTCDTSNADGGEVLLGLDADTTATLRSTGYWDLQTTRAGVVTTWLRGPVHVDADTTRV